MAQKLEKKPLPIAEPRPPAEVRQLWTKKPRTKTAAQKKAKRRRKKERAVAAREMARRNSQQKPGS